MFRSLWAITRNSFVEITRQPIYGILLLASMTLIGFSPLITGFTMTTMEDIKLVVDMGLGTIFLVGIVLATVSATQVINREIEAKTAGAIISKPVPRIVFVLGKFLGLTMAMALAAYILTIVLLMTVRMDVPTSAKWTMDVPVFVGEVAPLILALGTALYLNFFYRRNFTSTAVVVAFPLYTLAILALCFTSKHWQLEWFGRSFLTNNGDQVLRAAVLVFMGVWVISSVAVAASTRVNVVYNVLICLTVFFIGMISRFLFRQALDFSWDSLLPDFVQRAVPSAAQIAKAVWSMICAVGYRLVPSLQIFWVADQLVRPEPYIPPDYLGMAALYAVAWCAAMVTLAAFLFERRDIV